MKTITVQPSEHVDNIRDGHEFTRLPYPYHVEEDGSVGRQDFWDGKPKEIVGFQRDLAKQQIDLWWRDAWREPQQAVGMYIVMRHADGGLYVQSHAVRDMTVNDDG